MYVCMYVCVNRGTGPVWSRQMAVYMCMYTHLLIPLQCWLSRCTVDHVRVSACRCVGVPSFKSAAFTTTIHTSLPLQLGAPLSVLWCFSSQLLVSIAGTGTS